MVCLSAIVLFSSTLRDDAIDCALCRGGDSYTYHAPCLFNLVTGELGELTVYDPHPVLDGELAEEQQDVFIGFAFCAGAAVTRNPSNHIATANVPSGACSINEALFCCECLEMLVLIGAHGYAILDMYDPEALQAYPIVDGADYEMRCYSVRVHLDGTSNRYAVEVAGDL